MLGEGEPASILLIFMKICKSWLPPLANLLANKTGQFQTLSKVLTESCLPRTENAKLTRGVCVCVCVICVLQPLSLSLTSAASQVKILPDTAVLAGQGKREGGGLACC